MSQTEYPEFCAAQIRRCWHNTVAGHRTRDYFKGWLNSDPRGVQHWSSCVRGCSEHIAGASPLKDAPSLTFGTLTAVDQAGTNAVPDLETCARINQEFQATLAKLD